MTADLLKRILAHPDDRDTRLVYADAIAAKDPARGELIVVEDRLAGIRFDDPQRAALLRRRAELRDEHGDRWWPEFPLEQLDTRGGFVRVLTVEPGQFGESERLLAREPITRLAFVDHAPSITPRWKHSLRGIAIHSTLDWVTLAAVARSFDTRISAVTASRIRGGGGLPAGLPWLGTHLDLSGSQLPESIAIARWTHTAAIRELSLAYTNLEELDLVALARHDWSSLRVLRLSGNRFGGRGLVPLARTLARCKQLERIELFECTVNPGAPAVDLLRQSCPQLVTEEPLGPATIRLAGHIIDLVWATPPTPGAPGRFAVVVDGKPVTTAPDAPLGRLVELVRRGRALVPAARATATIGPITLDLTHVDTGAIRVV